MKNFVFVTGFVLVATFLFGCLGGGEETPAASTPSATPQKTVSELAKEACVSLCLQEKQKNLPNWNDGPCLGNPLTGFEGASGWVCDVAHSPRQEIDNNPANQCSAFRDGSASHFVEVDAECGLIKVV